MRRKIFVILAATLVFALIFTACAADRSLQTPVQPGQDTTGQYNNTRFGTGTNTGRYTEIGPGANNAYDTGYGATGVGDPSYYGGYGNGTVTPTTQADRLARTCETVPGVDNATVVVAGNTAYVGVDTDGDFTGRNISTGTANNYSAVKRQCAQKIRASNPQIQTVYVSTDANFSDRLRKVGDGVRNGNTVNNFRNELNELVRNLTPERQ